MTSLKKNITWNLQIKNISDTYLEADEERKRHSQADQHPRQEHQDLAACSTLRVRLLVY